MDQPALNDIDQAFFQLKSLSINTQSFYFELFELMKKKKKIKSKIPFVSIESDPYFNKDLVVVDSSEDQTENDVSDVIFESESTENKEHISGPELNNNQIKIKLK
ncbi:MAG: hypothetical protein RL582_357 [Bacteroidota bacterium]